MFLATGWGRRLKRAREDAGLTQADAATALGVDVKTVSNHEREAGKRGPTPAQWERYATLYNVPIDLLLADAIAESRGLAVHERAPDPAPGISRELSEELRIFLYDFLAELVRGGATEREIDWARALLTRADNYTYAYDGTRKPMSSAEEQVEMEGLAEGVRIILRHRGRKLPKHR